MNVFELREELVRDYASFTKSFITIQDQRIRAQVDSELDLGLLWPEPLIQLNPAFAAGKLIDELVEERVLDSRCAGIFRRDKSRSEQGQPLRLHHHQQEAIRVALEGHNYVLSTGTGSGKSLAYMVPIVDFALRHRDRKGIKAIVVYPMNALANSQRGELEKFLKQGFPEGQHPVTFERYTGQEKEEERHAIWANPPDILLTNYVMLELILTRPDEQPLIRAAQGLRFLVLDELHTYRGRQGADVALLVRRVRQAVHGTDLQFIGTSATLSTEGSFDAQQREIAGVASRLFGADVRPEHIIGETLRRITTDRDPSDPHFQSELKAILDYAPSAPPTSFAEFCENPLSSWIETTFGVTREPDSDRLVRATPRRIQGPESAAHDLAAATGADGERCVELIQRWLLGGTLCQPEPRSGLQPFAFRLHQFVSRGDTVYSSAEGPAECYLTVRGQRFVPDGTRSRVLLPLAFCRECGQEYFVVRRHQDSDTGQTTYLPREISDRLPSKDGQPGFLYFNEETPWPEAAADQIPRLPEDWLDPDGDSFRIKSAQKKHVPVVVGIQPDGSRDQSGVPHAWFEAPFRFCLSCGVSYRARRGGDDFGKLASLSSGGRSTATTLMTLRTILYLLDKQELEPQARKLLSFTDNRQDASLQAGHFNDFIEVSAVRGGLFRAVQQAGPAGLRHDQITQAVFAALGVTKQHFAADPTVRFAAEEDTKQALRTVLGYRVYADLRRGWRITLPNLEQCGLLEIQYESLDDMAAAQDLWEDAHPLLRDALPETRTAIARTLLDHMRRELAIKVDYLNREDQERMRQQSSQRLRQPWALDENEQMESWRIVLPRPRPPREDGAQGLRWGDFVFLSARGGFGHYLRRTFAALGHPRPSLDETAGILLSLFEPLRQAGLVVPCDLEGLGTGWQVAAAAMRWVAGDGSRSFHDPIRVPNRPEGGAAPNEFFVRFYRDVALSTIGIAAREHTAQVPSEKREERERDFRAGKLPIMFCSPTMELGVDIAELNIVNLRNVPPTPANYAQRSGRAGRSGQPALVFTYCTSQSPHDQYFFKQPELMVAGKVTPPRIDLSNEDLVRAHIQAIFLGHTGVSLGRSLADVLDLSGDSPTLEVVPSKAQALCDPVRQKQSALVAEQVLVTLSRDLSTCEWWRKGWLQDIICQAPRAFDEACERWRSLYRAAIAQIHMQTRVILDVTKPHEERDQAKRLRREAEAQHELLTQADKVLQSDFYSYRYFASEGFLPGYSFPRLPVSAFIPARKGTHSDEFLSRPRFLAISEFGPRALIYHEGSKYVISRVLIGFEEGAGGGSGLPVGSAKRCEACGYMHPVTQTSDPDLCERCGTALPGPLVDLLRMQNVQTKRREKITADEEERQRMGFELRVAVRHAEREGAPSFRCGEVRLGSELLATLAYGHASTLWRINVGWRRRADPNTLGFVLDLERGYWAKNDLDPDDPDDPMTPRRRRVIPYVEDRKNVLIVDPRIPLEHPDRMRLLATMAFALKNAILVRYQLEDNEIAVEPLPGLDDRRLILLYEAAEGGAGVLRRLLDEPVALAAVARTALELCHFEPTTGEDVRRAPRAREDCEAACYDCLLSYSNQPDHQFLDRQLIRDTLLAWAGSTVEASQGPCPPGDLFEQLSRAAGSNLERAFLHFLRDRRLRLPTHAQKLFEEASTRPDFYYADHHAAIYIDGPIHDYPDRAARDRQQTAAMEDLGIRVIRLAHADDWEEIVGRFPDVFGTIKRTAPAQAPMRAEVDLEPIPPEWREVAATLATAPGVTVEGGWDVMSSGRVVGGFPLFVSAGPERLVAIVDASDPNAPAIEEGLQKEGLRVVRSWPAPLDTVVALVREALAKS